jgi:hypothetical protein
MRIKEKMTVLSGHEKASAENGGKKLSEWPDLAARPFSHGGRDRIRPWRPMSVRWLVPRLRLRTKQREEVARTTRPGFSFSP